MAAATADRCAVELAAGARGAGASSKNVGALRDGGASRPRDARVARGAARRGTGDPRAPQAGDDAAGAAVGGGRHAAEASRVADAAHAASVKQRTDMERMLRAAADDAARAEGEAVTRAAALEAQVSTLMASKEEAERGGGGGREGGALAAADARDAAARDGGGEGALAEAACRGRADTLKADAAAAARRDAAELAAAAAERARPNDGAGANSGGRAACQPRGGVPARGRASS